jgi:hypothetical protein
VSDIIEKIRKEWAVISGAPWSFCTTVCIAGAIIYGFVTAINAASLSAKDATIENLKTQIEGLKDNVASLENRETKNSTESTVTNPRDPDGIYQYGILVGSAQSVRIDESQGTILFGGIMDAAKLNIAKDIEYRDFILRIKNLATETRTSIGGKSFRSLTQVTCEIVGNRSSPKPQEH